MESFSSNQVWLGIGADKKQHWIPWRVLVGMVSQDCQTWERLISCLVSALSMTLQSSYTKYLAFEGRRQYSWSRPYLAAVAWLAYKVRHTISTIALVLMLMLISCLNPLAVNYELLCYSGSGKNSSTHRIYITYDDRWHHREVLNPIWSTRAGNRLLG